MKDEKPTNYPTDEQCEKGIEAVKRVANLHNQFWGGVYSTERSEVSLLLEAQRLAELYRNAYVYTMEPAPIHRHVLPWEKK